MHFESFSEIELLCALRALARAIRFRERDYRNAMRVAALYFRSQLASSRGELEESQRLMKAAMEV